METEGTKDTTLRLSKYFGNLPKFRLGFQNDYDLMEELRSNGKILSGIKRVKITASKLF